jgi:hypothetical protein
VQVQFEVLFDLKMSVVVYFSIAFAVKSNKTQIGDLAAGTKSKVHNRHSISGLLPWRRANNGGFR